MVYLAWTTTMYNRFRDWMRKARAWAAERALQIHGIVWDREDMSVIRGHHPPWVPEEFWHQLCAQGFFIYFMWFEYSFCFIYT